MGIYKNKTILITGGTGSFGQKFVSRLLDDGEAQKIIIFSRDELKQHDMHVALSQHPHFGKLRFFLGDVRDLERLKTAFRGVDLVVHAAALKQVPAAEYNPLEFVKTNINGAENIINAAVQNNVEKVVALSTDKASSPINLYGATKLCSDKLFIAGNDMFSGDETRFCVVRYGNVMGSRGSVVPFFRKLIDQGTDSLPITDERMTRFWITLEQALNLVERAFEVGLGGEIFVPKIPSVLMTALAHAMAPDLPQNIIGIRPGEKLHEEMISPADSFNTVDNGQEFLILPSFSTHLMDHYLANGAQRVAEHFSFTSENNQEIMSHEDLIKMLQDTGFA